MKRYNHSDVVAALRTLPDVLFAWDRESGPVVAMRSWGTFTHLTWTQAIKFTEALLAPRKGPGREMGRQSQQIRRVR